MTPGRQVEMESVKKLKIVLKYFETYFFKTIFWVYFKKYDESHWRNKAISFFYVSRTIIEFIL